MSRASEAVADERADQSWFTGLCVALDVGGTRYDWWGRASLSAVADGREETFGAQNAFAWTLTQHGTKKSTDTCFLLHILQESRKRTHVFDRALSHRRIVSISTYTTTTQPPRRAHSALTVHHGFSCMAESS